MPNPRGRPRRVTKEVLEKIIKQKKEGKTWTQIAQDLDLPVGTVSNAFLYFQKGIRKYP